MYLNELKKSFFQQTSKFGFILSENLIESKIYLFDPFS
jgi:hypothetical protein